MDSPFGDGNYPHFRRYHRTRSMGWWFNISSSCVLHEEAFSTQGAAILTQHPKQPLNAASQELLGFHRTLRSRATSERGGRGAKEKTLNALRSPPSEREAIQRLFPRMSCEAALSSHAKEIGYSVWPHFAPGLASVTGHGSGVIGFGREPNDP